MDGYIWRSGGSQMIGTVTSHISSFTSVSYDPAPSQNAATRNSAENDTSTSAMTSTEDTSESKSDKSKDQSGMDTVTLSKNETAEVEKLKSRDVEVRKHEQAHKAVAGKYATGGASFEYQVGPDGKRYAVGGEVSIDLSKGRTPEETIQKASAVRAAALAPAEPSAQDRKVAAMASQMEQEARQAQAVEQQEKTSEPEQADESQPDPTAAPQDTSTQAVNDTDNIAPPPDIAGAAPAAPRNIAPASERRENRSTPEPSPASQVAERDRIDSNNRPEKLQPSADRIRKTYQENSPSSLSPVDTATAGMVSLSMAI